MAAGSLRHEHPKEKYKMASFHVVCRSVINHPFLMVMLLIFICLHQYFPFLFSLLVSASPVVICTAILLGILLIHGQPNDNNVKNYEERNNTYVTIRTGVKDHTSSAEREGVYFKDRFAEVRKDIVEKGMRASGTLGSGISIDGDYANGVNRENCHAELTNRSKIHKEKIKNSFEFADFENASVEVHMDRDFDKTINEQHDVGLQDQLNSSMGIEKHADGTICHEYSDCESDGGEKSSLDALVAYVIPTAQETHPLLDFEDQLHQGASHDDASLKFELQSLDSHQSNEDSSEDENDSDVDEDETLNIKDDGEKLAGALLQMEKNQQLESLINKTDGERDEEEEVEEDEGTEDMDVDDDEDDDDDEENANVEKDATKQVTLWTEEDEKNLRLVGNSELERDLRLENLLARRRAKRNFSLISERNLIDLDRPDQPSFQVAPISTSRVNPFDSPHDTKHQQNNLPPIPGSAPSVSVPRRNPFDSPCTSPKGTHNLTGNILQDEHVGMNSNDAIFHDQNESSSIRYDARGKDLKSEFAEVMKRKDAVFRRYESFNPGYNFVGDSFRQDFTETDRRDAVLRRHETFNTRSAFPNTSSPTKKPLYLKMKPVFVSEQVVEDPDVRHPSSDRESSHDSESIMSSSDSDHTESSKIFVKHEDLGPDKDALVDGDHVSNLSEDTSESSNEADSLKGDEEEDFVDRFKASADQIHEKIEAAHENHENASSSSTTTSEADHSSDKTVKDGDETTNEANFSCEASSHIVGVNHLSMEEDHDTIEPPVYDSSPSSVGKNTPFSSEVAQI